MHSLLEDTCQLILWWWLMKEFMPYCLNQAETLSLGEQAIATIVLL